MTPKEKAIFERAIDVLKEIKMMEGFNNDSAVLNIGRQLIRIFPHSEAESRIEKVINFSSEKPASSQSGLPPGVIEPRLQKKNLMGRMQQNEKPNTKSVLTADNEKVNEAGKRGKKTVKETVTVKKENVPNQKDNVPKTDKVVPNDDLAFIKENTIDEVKKKFPKVEDLLIVCQNVGITIPGEQAPTYEKVIKILKLK